MKKILFISPTGTLDNGAEKSTLQLMKHLVDKGYWVGNVYPENSHSTYAAYQAFHEAYQIEQFPLAVVNWWWEESPAYLHASHAKRVESYHQQFRKLRDILRDEKIDLVISNTANVFQGAVAAALEGVSHYWFIHEYPEEEFAYYRDKLDFMRSHSDRLFAASPALAAQLNQLLGQEAVSSFLPYSHIPVHELRPQERVGLVSVGRITANKNQLELLAAYELLCQRMQQEVPLVLIGGWDEDYKAVCDQFIAEKKLQNVHFLGHQEAPWRLVGEKDCCILPSKMESFGLVYVEAILNGIPTIAADNPGYQSVQSLLEEGDLYTLSDVAMLATKMEEVFARFDEKKAGLLSRKEALRANYNLDNCYSVFLEALKERSSQAKPLSALSFLLGDVQLTAPAALCEEKVTIYYAGQKEAFSQERTQVFDLKDQDRISLVLPEGVTKIRIDLSEKPCFYRFVRLTSKRVDTLLLPTATNAKVLNDSYLFLEADPQLVYYLPQELFGNEFELSYASLAPSADQEESGVVSVLDGYVQHFQRKLALQKEQIEQQQRELQESIAQYNRVIHSRRWTIPTTIINFFRRKQ